MFTFINNLFKYFASTILSVLDFLVNIPVRFFSIIYFLTGLPSAGNSTLIKNDTLVARIDLREIGRISDNVIVFYMVIMIHLPYLFLLKFCKNWDRIDNFMLKKAIQLNDVPFGSYKYLVIIYTNWRPSSGTRSKIFLQLHGNLGQNTVCFYLHNPFLPHRQLFGWGDISFFMINTANPIGDIQAITIGHDNSVDSSWFLSKVLVKDIQMNKEFRFFAHCWIVNDLNSAELHSLVTLKPVDPHYVETYGERVFEWIRRCYRERYLMSFLYLNLLTRQSRVTRLNITYFYVTLTMLVNMLYFDEKEDKLSYVFLKKITSKGALSYIILLIIYQIFNIKCFTNRYPTKRQFNIRMMVYIGFVILHIAHVITLLIYSSSIYDKKGATLAWLGNFVLGLVQSEFLLSVIFSFGQAVINIFFSKDPFLEEQAQIIYTYRNKSFKYTNL